MNSFNKLTRLFFLMELRNKQAVIMSTLFPLLMMFLMGTAGKDASRDGMSYMTFIFPGILGMAYGATAVIAVPVMIASYRERGILKHLKIAPISNLKFLISIFTTQLFIMLIQTIIILLISIFVFDVELDFYTNGIIQLIILAFLGNLALVSWGFIIGNIASSSKNATTLGNLTNLTTIFLGGTFFEASVWPAVLQPLVKINPMSYMIESIRKTLIYGSQTNANYLIGLGAIIVIMIVSMVLATKTFKYE